MNDEGVEVFKLSNGDVFEKYGMILEYEDDILYGVSIRKVPIKGGIGNKIVAYREDFKRTGITFTLDEFNGIIKNIENNILFGIINNR